MVYSINPLTEEQIMAQSLMEKGSYDFEVVKALRKVSKAGNPMCELTLNVWDSKGVIHSIFDYLVFSNQPLNIKKVKHFCEAVGLQEDYQKGHIPEELETCSGKLELGIQSEKENPNGGLYPSKNIVLDYIKSGDKVAPQVKVQNDMPDDDIPF